MPQHDQQILLLLLFSMYVSHIKNMEISKVAMYVNHIYIPSQHGYMDKTKLILITWSANFIGRNKTWYHRVVNQSINFK
jgi:hypothetical protein